MSVKKILKELLEDNPDYSGRLDILALQQFITPDYCLKCGRKLNDED